MPNVDEPRLLTASDSAIPIGRAGKPDPGGAFVRRGALASGAVGVFPSGQLSARALAGIIGHTKGDIGAGEDEAMHLPASTNAFGE